MAIVLLLTLLIWPGTVAAHARLETSTVGAGAILPAVPASITLTFSEAIDPAFSSGSLITSTQEVVSAVNVTLDPAGDHSAIFTIERADALPAGSYALVWRVVSSVDGHATTGLLAFSAGTGVSPDIASSTASATSSWAATIGRWLELASLIALTGSTAFALVAGHHAPVSTLLLRISHVAAPLFMLGWVLAAGALLGTTSGGGWGAWPGWQAARDLFTTTSPGHALVIRLAVVTLVGGIALIFRYRSAWHAAFSALLSAAGLATFAFTGHAAGLHGNGAIAVDLVHLLVAALWAGGLLLLALTLHALLSSGQPNDLRRALRVTRRFSALALAALTIVAVTGVLSAAWNVGGPRNLTGEDYGLLLIAKVVLVLLIVTVAAVNRLLLVPRLTAALGASNDPAASSQISSLARAALIEIGIAVAVLLLTARLTGLAPANGPLAVDVASRSGPISIAASGGDVQFVISGTLESTPDGLITISVTDALSGEPVTDLARLIVLATAPNPLDPEGERLRDRFDADQVAGSPGAYAFPRTRLGVEAIWTLDIAARRLGVEDAVAVTEIDLQGTAPQPPRLVDDQWRWPRVAWTGWLAMLAAAVTAAGGLWLVRRLKGLEPVTAGIMLAVTALITVGFLLSAYRSGPLPIEGAPVTVPSDLGDEAVIQRAAGGWAQQCASCHGVTAGGTGEQAPGQEQAHSHPSASGDLLGAASRALTSRERYWAITNGIGGTSMPAFDIALSERERWDLVAYLEWLQAQADDSQD